MYTMTNFYGICIPRDFCIHTRMVSLQYVVKLENRDKLIYENSNTCDTTCSIETLFRRGSKHYNCVVTNTPSTEGYEYK